MGNITSNSIAAPTLRKGFPYMPTTRFGPWEYRKENGSDPSPLRLMKPPNGLKAYSRSSFSTFSHVNDPALNIKPISELSNFKMYPILGLKDTVEVLLVFELVKKKYGLESIYVLLEEDSVFSEVLICSCRPRKFLLLMLMLAEKEKELFMVLFSEVPEEKMYAGNVAS
jgi:hypothetical protein